MPSLEHDSLILLFRNQPELAAQLLREALHVELPAYTEARLASSDLTEVVPAEFRADAVVLFVDGDPVLGVVVEVQLSRVDQKLFAWPAYVSVLRSRHKCPVELLVLTHDQAVAAWASKPIQLDLAGASVLRPRVLGPDAVPVVTDLAQAARKPELAVLSALAHGRGDVDRAVQIALAAVAGVEHISDRDLFVLYCDLIDAALSDAARKAFQMLPPGYQFQSELVRNSIEKGRAEGRATEKAADVIDVLDARGLTVTPAQRERILGCSDLEQLKTWLRRAVTVASADELFSA